MTDSMVDVLAKSLSYKLGRRVTVGRFKDGTIWRYGIGIEGCFPPMFSNLTVGEAKGRLAMLSDMLSSQVIQKGPPCENGPPSPSQPGTTSGPSSPHETGVEIVSVDASIGHIVDAQGGERVSLTLKSTCAILDVEGDERFTLDKYFKSKGSHPIPVHVTGKISNAWGSDDGTSIEFTIDVDTAVLHDILPGTR